MDQTLPSGPLGSDSISAALASSGCLWSEVPFTREGWDGEFSADGLVKTFLGSEVRIFPASIEFPDTGPSLLGLIRPTLEQPAYVISQDREVSFHRAILGADREVLGYSCVTLGDDSLTRVSVSSQPARFADIVAGVSGGSDLVSDASADGEAIFKCLSASLACHASNGASNASILVTDFDLAASLLGWGREFSKSEHGPIPADARWITVHPNGPGSKGVAILVQPAKDNSGTMHVIGGAGGKLNMLKLRGVKSEGEYKQEHAERSAEKRQAKKESVRRDKELGLHKAKSAARDNITAQRKSAQATFVKTVGEAMGWTPEEMTLDTHGLSPEPMCQRASGYRGTKSHHQSRLKPQIH